MRARFEGEDIECRVDSTLQGGLKGNVEAKVMVNSTDAARAVKIVRQSQESMTDQDV